MPFAAYLFQTFLRLYGSRLTWFLSLLSPCVALGASDPFADIVRKTEPLSPQEEQKRFHLPPGFVIELVASEPQISKPMNMAFDDRGRLWITDSREYPFPAPKDRKGHDTIKVLDRFRADGGAEKITTFADGLNIPIGLYPYRDGVIAFSIPNISHFKDTNGDGRADTSEILYGPLGFEKDTHGMTSAFRRGFDGWLYACHGFNNTTTLRGKDGSSITLQSGNTYRMRADGSRVEQFTWGQVNPFGLTFDPLGNLYSADCHTFPIYQLLRGGHYPSFGKPHDGLGFAPAMMNHFHGSTAIGGIVFYNDVKFPKGFANNFFVGNVMTCRINRDSIAAQGSTWIAKEEPDFLSCDDPWFRPVDLQLGPDGAIYVADFYNRIIGHYEVPLDHPGRDRERGRIWRIRYAGTEEKSATTPASAFDLSGVSTLQLIGIFGDPNPTRRMLAMNRMVDTVGSKAVPELRKALHADNAFRRIHVLWSLHRLGALDPAMIQAALQDADRGVRTHALHILSESFTEDGAFPPPVRDWVWRALSDADPFVRRAAADALGQHPAVDNVLPLLQMRRQIAADDTHLTYVVRRALRNQLEVLGGFSKVDSNNETDLRTAADVALGVATHESASFLLNFIQKFEVKKDLLIEYLRHIARHDDEGEGEGLVKLVQSKFSADIDFQLSLFKSLQDGTRQRGGELSESARQWGRAIATKLMEPLPARSLWRNEPIPNVTNPKNPWFLQKRTSADGDQNSLFLSSLPPGGESLTGVLRSPIFTVPEQLELFIAGHDGYPEKPAQKKNRVRLVSADSGQVWAESFPPRHDTAQRVEWDLQKFTGKQGVLEIIDGDTGPAYAWLAVGRLKPAVITLPSVSPSEMSGRAEAVAELVATLHLAELKPQLQTLLLNAEADAESQAAAARSLLALEPEENLEAISFMVGDSSVPAATRNQIAAAIARHPGTEAALLAGVVATSPRRLQIRAAQNLAGNKSSAQTLLRLVEEKKWPRALLQAPNVKENLAAASPENARRVKQLTEGLASMDEQRQKLIDMRRGQFRSELANTQKGKEIFAQNCAACHQIGGQGGTVGPQLDGVGNRGAERLVEDILDPNRNVDSAFRYSTLTLKDDSIINALQRREEGELLVFADATGKEIKVAKGDIRGRQESENSLMPDNFGELIPEIDFYDLIAFLLSNRSAAQQP